MSLLKKFIYLFETIRVESGVALNLAYHEKRVLNSLGFLPRFNLSEILKFDKIGLFRAKVVYDLNGNLISCDFFEYKISEFYKFHLVDISFSYDKKYLDRSHINMAKNGFSEIVMIKDGLVTDTSIANIAIYDEISQTWLTPKSPLLSGTTRARLLESGFLKEEDISTQMLLNTKKFAILNAMVGFFEIKKFKFI